MGSVVFHLDDPLVRLQRGVHVHLGAVLLHQHHLLGPGGQSVAAGARHILIKIYIVTPDTLTWARQKADGVCLHIFMLGKHRK